MRWGALLICLLSASLAAKSLKVATDVWPPFRMQQDGELIGYDIDVLNEVGRRTGITFEIELMPWVRALRHLEYGQSDLMVGLALTAERDRYIDYLAQPYHQCRPAFYGQARLSQTLQSYGDLSDLSIGMVKDSAYFPRFDQDNDLNKVSTARENQLLLMAQSGNIDVLVGTDCQVDYQLIQQPQLTLSKAPFQPDSAIELYYGFSEEAALASQRAAIAQALSEMQADRFFYFLNQRYFNDP